MDSSRRAVESYWRSRMIDATTSDEYKVTPVYTLEEICELFRSSHVSIVKEVSEFILKRLEHKGPAVKQKDNEPAPTEGLNKQIQGFGNTNFETQSDDKISFLSKVVGLGNASLKQELSSFTQGHSLGKNDNGSYKSPTLQRSLTTETEYSDRCEPVELRSDAWGSFGILKNAGSGPWSGIQEY